MTSQFPDPPQIPDAPVIIGGGPPEWLAPVIVVSLLAIISGILLYPMARAWARRTEGSVADQGLADEVVQLRERVAELEHNQMMMQELSERMDFAERLLAQRNEPVRLPREDRP